MAINNISAFHAAMAALAPIVGVDSTGRIFFDPSATAAQIAAANAAAATYTDVPPQLIAIELALSRMTDTEYQALFTLASTRAVVHRLLQYVKQIDMSTPQAQAMLQSLVTGNIFASLARAQAVFAPPPPQIPPISPAPPPGSGVIFVPPAPLLGP